MQPINPSHTSQAVRDAKASGGHTVPETKGWFARDRVSLIRATLATAGLALMRTFVLSEPQSKLFDPANVSPFLLFLNADQLSYKAWHKSSLEPGGTLVCSAGATLLAFLLMRDGLDSLQKCAMYGLSAGALYLIAREGTQQTYLSQNNFVNYVV